MNYDSAGTQVVARDQLQVKADRYYYQQSLSLSDGEVLLTPFDLNIENGQIENPRRPVVRMITPLHDRHQEKRGLLVLNYQGKRVLDKMSEVARNTRGTPILANWRGGYILPPEHSEAWGWMLGNQDAVHVDYPAEWDAITAAPSGQMATENGVFTFRWLDPLSSQVAAKIARPLRSTHSRPQAPSGPNLSSLLILSHVTPSDAYRESSNLVRMVVIALLFAHMVIATFAWHWSQAAVVGMWLFFLPVAVEPVWQVAHRPEVSVVWVEVRGLWAAVRCK